MALYPCPECGNLVSDTATNCPKCGFNLSIKKNIPPTPPQNTIEYNNNLKKPVGCFKLILWGIGGSILLLLLIGIVLECSGNSSKPDTNTNNIVDVKDDNNINDPEKVNLNAIEREIKAIEKGIDFNTYRGSINQLQAELVLFGVWSKLINEAGSYENNIKKANELKRLVENIQQKQFPILRKEYAKESDKIMWEHDIKVTSSSNHSILNVTGGVFAANKNKKEYQERIQKQVKEFRFKQVRYRWYEGEDEYTYYTVYEGKDSDLFTY